MRPVKVNSHYGQPIILDQCGKCGGIWFDESELFRAKQGEAERIEWLDAEALRIPAEMESATGRCPKDGGILFQFKDERFPEDVLLERCPACRGIWLNRGNFTEFQKGRQQRLRPREIWIQADGSAGPAPPAVLPRSGGNDEMVRKIGAFLSTELDPLTMRPLDTTRMSPEELKAFDTIMNVITSLLGLLPLR
jgi:Zn-finger nucleic acid-binding protein